MAREARSARMDEDHGLDGTRWEPFWLREPAPRATGLKESLETDVLVVGGGITGTSLAHHLADLKTDFVLLEKDSIGSGATGRCAGGLAPGTELDYCEAIDRFGIDMASKLWRYTAEAIDGIKDLGRTDALDFGFVEGCGVYLAKSKGDVKLLEREYRAIQGSGFRGELFEGSKGKELLNSDLNSFGVLRYDGLGVVDPVRLVRGLASSLRRRLSGTKSGTFEDTPVAQIQAKGGGFQVRTDEGSVSAHRVVLATESFTNDLAGRRVVHPVRVHSIVTSPVESDVLAALRLDRGKMIWDTGALYNFIRVTADNRILIDGGDTVASSTDAVGPELDASAARLLRRRLVELFPRLAGVPVEYGWSGTMGFTTRRLPMIGEDPRVKNLFYSVGYGGHGLPFGFLAGQLLAETCAGRVSDQGRECLDMFRPRTKSQLSMALESLAMRPYFAYLRARS